MMAGAALTVSDCQLSRTALRRESRCAAHLYHLRSLSLSLSPWPMAWLHHLDLSLSPAKAPRLTYARASKRGQRRPGRIAATGGRQCERACMQPTGPCTGDRCTQLLFFTDVCGRSVCRWPCLLRLAKLDASVGTCAVRAAWHGGRQCSGVLLVSWRASVKPSRAIVSTARQGLCTGNLGPCTLRDSSCSAMDA